MIYLESANGSALETEVGLKILGDFANQTLEWQLADEQLGRFLVSADLTQSDSAGTVSVWLLHATSLWWHGILTGSLRGQQLARGLAAGRLASGLLSAGHDGNAGNSEKIEKIGER